MTAEDFDEVVRRALEALKVADQVTLIGAAVAADGGKLTAEVRIGDGSETGGGGGAAVTIAVASDLDAERMESEVRAELRRGLRMCPLCDRIGHVEKLRGASGQQEGCAVRCAACGEYEIDQELVRRFRSAHERHDAMVLDRLPALSERTRGASEGAHVRITTDNWRGESGGSDAS